MHTFSSCAETMPNLQQSSGELPVCPICCDLLGKYGGPSTLPCGHNGCLDCFAHVQSRNPHCPLCRAPFDPKKQLACNYELKDLISMATSVFMDDKTKEEGWEAFPTAKLTAAHYAHEVQAEARNQPLQHLLNNFGSSSTDGYSNSTFIHQQGMGRLSDASDSGRIDASAVAGGVAVAAARAGSSSSASLQHHDQLRQPRLPQSAPSGTQRDILLMEPPQWLPDSYASQCGGCQLPFKPLLRLRHHCRLCGKLYCHSCSSKQLLLPPRFKERDPQRVCTMCATVLEPLQPFLVGATAASVHPAVHDALDAISLRSWLNTPWSSCMADDLYKAANILRVFNEAVRIEPERGLPSSLLAGAKGLALLSVVKLGAGWSCTAGTGVVVSRQRNGTWSAPCAAACYGLGWGLQIGGGLTDVLLVLRTEEAVRAFASGQTLGLGGNMGLAVGPLGRSAEASVRLGGITARGAVVGYSCSRGMFIGVSLEGSVTCSRDAVNKRFYGYPVTAKQLLVDCSVPQPPAAAMLYDGLDALVEKWENRGLLVHSKAGIAAACSAAAASPPRKVPANQQQQQHAHSSFMPAGGDLHDEEDMEAYAEEYNNFEYAAEGYEGPVTASAPPAPVSALQAFSSSLGINRWQQQQQQQREMPARQQVFEAGSQRQHDDDEAAQDDDEEPQYVLEW